MRISGSKSGPVTASPHPTGYAGHLPPKWLKEGAFPNL